MRVRLPLPAQICAKTPISGFLCFGVLLGIIIVISLLYKGRSFIINIIYFIAMNKKFIGLFILLFILVGTIYYWKQGGVDKAIQYLSSTEIDLDRDIADMEVISQDTSLDGVEADLSLIGENGESVSLDALDADLVTSLDSLSADMADLETVAEDASLDSLDSGLSGI